MLADDEDESLLSPSAFAPTKRLGEEEVTRGLKACFAAAGRRLPAAVLEEAARRREESIGVDFFFESLFERVS